jgi:hypothetical protein
MAFQQIMTFDVLFDVVIFVVVINSFWRCDYSLFDALIFSFFDVLITLINLFDVVIVSNFFDVLFGFWHCEIRSSDLFPCGLTCEASLSVIRSQSKCFGDITNQNSFNIFRSRLKLKILSQNCRDVAASWLHDLKVVFATLEQN